MAIFKTAANLELWPEILPHYRYIRFLERGADRNIVVMAARRSGIPISWTSEQIIDRERLEIHFHHLKAWTKGMRVVWTLSDTPDGVLVAISHDFRFRIRPLAPISNRMKQRRAVITGIGPITCIGTGVEDFWDGISAERSGITSVTSFDASVFRVRCAGEIPGWDPEEFFSPHRLKRLDRYAQFAVVSAKLALDDAHIDYSREKPQDRIGVSFGTALGGVCKAEEQYIRYLKKGARGVQPTLAVQVFGGSAHSNMILRMLWSQGAPKRH